MHAVLLAQGRRIAAALAPARQPAFAGVATGSFVDSRDAAFAAGVEPQLAGRPVRMGPDPDRGHRPGPVDGAAGGRRRPGAVGQHGGVHGCLHVHDPGRLPDPQPALPHPGDRLHPDGRGPGPLPVQHDPAQRDHPARAGPGQRAAADDPRRNGHDRLRHLRDQLRGRGRLPDPGQLATGSPGCPRTRSSTRWPTARSSSASRSSPR